MAAFTTLHRTRDQIEAGLGEVRASPRGTGSVEMIVARPSEGDRSVLVEAAFTIEEGLVGDSWSLRPTRTGPGGGPDPQRQVTLMNARYLDLIAGTRQRWPLAGDQLLVDLDLSTDHLAPGDRLALGTVVLEVTAPPHTGCSGFMARFGKDALAVAGDRSLRHLNLRGIHARVVASGTVRTGDDVTKIERPVDQ